MPAPPELPQRIERQGTQHHTLPQLMTVHQFLTAVPLGRTSLYQRLNEGKIQSITIGRRRLIPVSEIARLIDQGAP